MSDEEEVIDYRGRVNLPSPSPDELEAAAEDILGPAADEALLSDGSKVFRGAAVPGVVFIQGPEMSCGTTIATAPRELQERVMDEARKVREAKVEMERADYIDPTKNEMIKFPSED